MVIVYHINPSQRVPATIERILSDWLWQAPACGEVPPPGTARDSQRLTLSSAVRLAFAPALYRGVTTIGRRWRWLRGDQPSRHRPSGACSAETKPAAGINGSSPAGSRCRSERLIADLASHRHAATSFGSPAATASFIRVVSTPPGALILSRTRNSLCQRSRVTSQTT